MEPMDWEVDSLAFSDQTEPESPRTDVDPEPSEARRFFVEQQKSRERERKRESQARDPNSRFCWFFGII